MDAAPSDRPSDASQVERAYREIKAGIVDGRYRPGAPLSEVMLAKAHNMSRTPVRESLTRLWQEHYLDRVAGHGFFVARVTVQLIHETFDVRRVLEGAAAAWAAARATEEEIAQLRHLASLPYACTLVRSNKVLPKLTSPLSKPSSAAIQRRRGLAWKSTSTAAAA